MYGRSRRYSGDGRVQHRKRLGKRELHPGRPEDESKFKMIMRPLGFTVMVWYDKGLLHLRTWPFLLTPEDCLKFYLPLKTSKKKMGLPLKKMDLPLKNFVKLKLHGSPPKEFRIFFTLLLKKSSIFPTYPWRIPFPGNKKPAFRYIECRTGGRLSLHGSRTKKANHETWISKFHFFGMVPDTFFCLVFTRRKKWQRSVWKKKEQSGKKEKKDCK